MKSLILRTATQFLMTLLLLYSGYLLIRGHNAPGGGFVGGLVASGAFALYAIAYDVPATRRALRVDPLSLLAVGLLAAAASGLPGVLSGHAFLTGEWTTLTVPGLGTLDVGTPLLFDIGVYLVVIGVTLTIVFTLLEDA